MKLLGKLLYVCRVLSLPVTASIVLLVLAVSMTVSCISLFVFGLYTSLGYTVKPIGEDMIVVYSGSALTPYTGLIPRSIEYVLKESSGIVNVWSEVVLPAIANGKPIIVRGVDTKLLHRIVGLKGLCRVLEDNPFTVIVGSTAASYLKVREGDTVTVYPLFTRIPVRLRVALIAYMDVPYDGELLVSLELAQKLRGVGENVVSMVKAVHSPDRSVEDILSSLKLETSRKTEKPVPLYLVERAATAILSGIGKPTIIRSSNYIDLFIKRFGFSRDILLIASTILAIISSTIVYNLGRTCIVLHYDRLRVLVVIGVSEGKVKLYVLAVYLPLIVLSILCGIIIAYYILEVYSFYIFGYRITPYIDYVTVLIQLATFTLLYTVGLLRCRIRL